MHAENPTENNAENLSAQFGMKLEQVRDVLARMTEHTRRITNDDAARIYYEDQIRWLQEVSVNTQFKEVKAESKIEGTYFPDLFGDDDLEEKKEALRQKIIEATRARPAVEFTSFMKSREMRCTPFAYMAPKSMQKVEYYIRLFA